MLQLAPQINPHQIPLCKKNLLKKRKIVFFNKAKWNLDYQNTLLDWYKEC